MAVPIALTFPFSDSAEGYNLLKNDRQATTRVLQKILYL